jgi:hypothetical protein
MTQTLYAHMNKIKIKHTQSNHVAQTYHFIQRKQGPKNFIVFLLTLTEKLVTIQNPRCSAPEFSTLYSVQKKDLSKRIAYVRKCHNPA